MKVKEVNSLNRSDLGISIIDINSLVIKGDGEYDRWFDLTKRKKMTKVSGAIHVIIKVSGTGLKSHSASLTSVDEELPFAVEEEDTSTKEPNTLTIKPLRGRNIEGMDMAGTSDVFIKFKLGLATETTSVIKKSKGDPVWNEGPYRLRQQSVKDDTLVISVRDEDQLILGKTTWNLIGDCNVKIATLKNRGKVRQFYSVERNGKVRGEVELEMEWLYLDSVKESMSAESVDVEGSDGEEAVKPGESDPKKLEEEEKKRQEEQDALMRALESTKIVGGTYQIRAHIIKAKSLAAKDLQGTSDPCVHIHAFGKKMTTKVKKETLNPSWDEYLYIDFTADKETINSSCIEVHVYDANTIARNELIGSYSFDANWLYHQPDHEIHKQWIGLSDNSQGDDSKLKGYLQLSLVMLGPSDTPAQHKQIDEIFDPRSNVLMPASIKKDIKFLVIGVHKGEELPNMDGGLENGIMAAQGGIDAYVEVVYGKNKPLKTKYKTIKGKTNLNPVWNEELWIPIVEPALAKAFQLSVKDYDTLSADDIGE